MAASKKEKAAQKARSRRYSIAIREDGNVTKPSKWEALSESRFGDPVSYLFPVPDKAHAKNAKSRFSQFKENYDTRSRGVVRSRLNRLLRKFDVDPIENDDNKGDEEEEFTGNMVGRIILEDDDDTPGVLIPAARIATFKHPWYGDLYFDHDLFESFIDNFETDVVGTKLAIDAEHRRNGMLGGMALAWVDKLFVGDDNVFHIHATPTETGMEYLGKEYKYASIEYHPRFSDQETGIEYGPTLMACAATNHPFVHRNAPIDTVGFENVEQTLSGVFFFAMPDVIEKQVPLEEGGNMPNKKEVVEETPPKVEPQKTGPSSLTLPDGQVLSPDDVAAILARTTKMEARLKQAEVDRACGEAQDRGVPQVVVNVARQFMDACDPDAPPSITLDTGEPKESPKTLNMFYAIDHLLNIVPGRIGEVTFTPKGESPPVKQETANPYTSKEKMTPEEAEAYARKRHEELGLRRSNQAEAEL